MYLTVLIRSPTLAGDPLGVTEPLANEQVAAMGRLLQLKFTCWLKPFAGVTSTV
jgi:hypothetical protein